MSKEEHLLQWIGVLYLVVIIWLVWPAAHHVHDVMNYPPAIQMHGEP